MYATPESLPKLTPAEYLDWESQGEVRHELVDGYLYVMTQKIEGQVFPYGNLINIVIAINGKIPTN